MRRRAPRLALGLVAAVSCLPKPPPSREGSIFVAGSLAAVTNSRAAVNRQDEEERAHWPLGSLRTEATIERNRPGEICFAVMIRQRETEGVSLQPSTWRVTLRSEDRTEAPSSVLPFPSKRVTLGSATEPGSDERVRCADYDIREGRCATYEVSTRKERPFTERTTPEKASVMETGGRFCFANIGLITSLTKQIVLEVESEPVLPAPSTFVFRWNAK